MILFVTKKTKIYKSESQNFNFSVEFHFIVFEDEYIPAIFDAGISYLFPGCSSSPLPSHIFICLTPKTEADRYFVEQRGQNPLIRIRVAIGDQLSRIFSFLKIKWNLRMQKLVSFSSKLFRAQFKSY